MQKCLNFPKNFILVITCIWVPVFLKFLHPLPLNMNTYNYAAHLQSSEPGMPYNLIILIVFQNRSEEKTYLEEMCKTIWGECTTGKPHCSGLGQLASIFRTKALQEDQYLLHFFFKHLLQILVPPHELDENLQDSHESIMRLCKLKLSG